MRLTVGPLPPAVYWRRRAIVLGAILLVLFLVTQAFIAASADDGDSQSAGPPSSPDPSAGAESTPTTDPSPSGAVAGSSADPTTDPGDAGTGSDPSDEPGGAGVTTGAVDPASVPECADEDMVVTAEAERTRVSVGAEVRFDIQVRNAADEACRRDVGSGQRELFLRRGSGADKVWSSRDCVDLRDENEQVLQPGFRTNAWVEWNGRASTECDGPQPDGDELSPDEYELVGRLGTVYSEPVTITVE